MVSWTFHLFLLLGLVGSDIIRQNLNILPINPSNIKDDYTTSVGNQWRSFKEKSQYSVDRSRCSKGWQRFGGSCYHLSNVTSRSIKANKTCKRHYLNNFQLMQILYPSEIYFAAYILNKNNRSELLVQINSHLSKDNKFVKFVSSNEDIKKSSSAKNKLRQKLRTNSNRKAKRSAQSQGNEGMNYDNLIDDIMDTQIDSHSPTLTTNENDHLKEEEFDDIYNICDKLSWNVVNNYIDVFLLIISKDLTSNKIICSINDIESNRTYQYMCQYVFDFCFGNDQCGHHGRCVNNPSGFNCSCYFYTEGLFCKEISTIFIHLLIGIFIVGFFFILKKFGPQNYQYSIIKKITDYFQKQPITPESMVNDEGRIGIPVEPASPSEPQQHSIFHVCFKSSVMCLIHCCLGFIPAYYHWNIFQSDSYDQLKLDSLINDNAQCEHKYVFFMENYNFVIISILLCIMFCILIKFKSNYRNVYHSRSGYLSPIEPFALANRWETAALCGLVVLEVLMALEHFFIDLGELWNQSVLIQFVKRTFIPVLYGIRYYPLFISLQQRGKSVRGLAFVYILGNIIYIIIRRSLCVMDFLAFSKNYSPVEEAKHRLELGNWVVFYGFIKSVPQFILLSYIGSELLARFVFGSNYPYTVKILNNSTDQSDSSYWSKISKYIYQWDKNFRYTTMAMCSYTVAFVLLYYLTCVFAFQFLMGMSSMSFIRFCLENIFNIEMKTWSFRYEILITAFLIFLIFAHRFLKVMMKYKEHTNDLKNENYEEIPQLNEKEEKSIAVKSVGYLSSIFLSIVGGFFIWFHIILFIIIIIFRTLSFCVFNPELPRIELILKLVSIILPMLVLYGLKKYITEWLCTFISVDSSSNRNQKFFNENFYGILVYFTFLISCHIAVVSTLFRLIKGILYNILLIPQVDSSHFGQKYQKKDSVFMAYVSFLYMERNYRLETESRSPHNSVQNRNTQAGTPSLERQMSPTDTSEITSDSATQSEQEELSTSRQGECLPNTSSSLLSPSVVHRTISTDKSGEKTPDTSQKSDFNSQPSSPAPPTPGDSKGENKMLPSTLDPNEIKKMK